MMESEIRADHHKGKVVWVLDPDIAETYAVEIDRLAYRGAETVDHGFAADSRELFAAVTELKEHDPDL